MADKRLAEFWNSKKSYIVSGLAMVATGAAINGAAHYYNNLLLKEKPSLEASLAEGQLKYASGRILEPLDLDPAIEGNDAVFVTKPFSYTQGVIFANETTTLNTTQLYENLLKIRPGLSQSDVVIERVSPQKVDGGLAAYNSLKNLEFRANMIEYEQRLDVKGENKYE